MVAAELGVMGALAVAARVVHMQVVLGHKAEMGGLAQMFRDKTQVVAVVVLQATVMMVYLV